MDFTRYKRKDLVLGKERLLNIIENFSKKKIIVIGDLVADEYILGITSRVSREAPVLILKYDSTKIQPGGAANSVKNIYSLGGSVIPIGVVGNDNMGKKLLELFRKDGIDTTYIITTDEVITPSKTRILAGGANTVKQQVIRIDKEHIGTLPKKVGLKLISAFKEGIKKADAVIVSDYGLGVISDDLLELINEVGASGKMIIVVDSRYDILKYRNITAATPNTEEIEWAMGVELNKGNIKDQSMKLFKKLKAQALLVTRGKDGMLLLERRNRVTDIEISGTDEIADVTGAGDTVISAFTISLAAGADIKDAALIANYAAGIVVMKSGTANANISEVKKSIEYEC